MLANSWFHCTSHQTLFPYIELMHYTLNPVVGGTVDINEHA